MKEHFTITHRSTRGCVPEMFKRVAEHLHFAQVSLLL